MSSTVKQNGGFTLIEVIVSMSIALIILGVTMTILISSMNLSSRSIQSAQNSQILESTLSFAEEQLKLVGDIEKPPGNLNLIIVDQGELLFIGDPVSGAPVARGDLYYRLPTAAVGEQPINAFSESFYSGKLLSMEIKVVKKVGQRTGVTISMTLYNDTGGVEASRSRSLILVNSPMLAADDPPSEVVYSSGDILRLLPPASSDEG